MYGDNVIRKSTARKWFSRFKKDRFDISDTPSEFDEDRLNTLIHNDPRKCSRELANVMNCDHSTIVRHLNSMGKVQSRVYGYRMLLVKTTKISGWLYYCTSLLGRHRLAREHRAFLSCIVTGDEKWCLYANMRKIKEWLNPIKKRICRNVSISPPGTPFSSVHVSTHYFQMTNQYVSSSTTIELQIKNDNR